MGTFTSDIPEGYITGLSRRRVWQNAAGNVQYTVAHLYKGDFSDVGQPMCKRGYEAAGDISIWRGNVGDKGICNVCLRRARAGLPPAPWPTSGGMTTRWASVEAQEYHMWVRRRLGVRDNDNAPDVDEAIRMELEQYSLAAGQVSLARIMARLKVAG